MPPGKILMIFVVCRFFSKSNFLENSFRKTISVLNSLVQNVCKDYQQMTLVEKELSPFTFQIASSLSGWVVTWFLFGYTVRKNGGQTFHTDVLSKSK